MTLIEIPQIQTAIDVFIRGANAELFKLLIPVSTQSFEGIACVGIGVFIADDTSLLRIASAQKETAGNLFAWLQGVTLLKCTAVIATELKLSAHFAFFHRDGVLLTAIITKEAITQAVKTIGGKGRSEKFVAIFFIMKFIFHCAVFIARTCGIQTHLEVLIVHVDMMETELTIAIQADVSHTITGVFECHFPDFDIIIHGDEQGLLACDAIGFALIGRIPKTMTAFVFGGVKLATHGLPAQGPIVLAVVIAHIHIMPRTIQWNAIGAETCNAMILRATIPQIASCVLIYHSAHAPLSQVVGKALGDVDLVYHIFPSVVIEITVFHH